MKRIPIVAAKLIAKKYGYDQVIIYARKVGEKPDPHREHLTTYGINKVHCGIAARIGSYLKREILKWEKTLGKETEEAYEIQHLIEGLDRFYNEVPQRIRNDFYDEMQRIRNFLTNRHLNYLTQKHNKEEKKS